MNAKQRQLDQTRNIESNLRVRILKTQAYLALGSKPVVRINGQLRKLSVQ